MKPVFAENEKKFGRQHLNLNMTSSVLPCKLQITVYSIFNRFIVIVHFEKHY